MTGFATVGGAVAFVALLVSAADSDSPPPSLRLGDTGTSAGFSATLLAVECGKSRKDLPRVLRRAERNFGERFPIKGQLCFGRFRFQNRTSTANAVQFNVNLLRVRDEQYPSTGAAPLFPPQLFPDEEARVVFIYDLPKMLQPTHVRLSVRDGDELEWELL